MLEMEVDSPYRRQETRAQLVYRLETIVRRIHLTISRVIPNRPTIFALLRPDDNVPICPD